MHKIKDLTGEKHNKLTSIGYYGKINNKNYELCLCDCNKNKKIIIRRDKFTSGKTKSCGCSSVENARRIGLKNIIDLTGKIFGKLTVIKLDHKINNGKIAIHFYLCQCSCGNKKIIRRNYLASKQTQSCGRCRLLIKERPDLIEEWDFEKNKDININDVTVGKNIKCWWICKKCNYRWFASINGRGTDGCNCPACNESHGEKKIRLFLEEQLIKFEKEKRFSNCRNKNPLPFDFYLPHYNILIEYQGQQHYGKSNRKILNDYKDINKNDKIKEEYCKKHNIKLIKIPYWDQKNIEDILFKELI